MMPYSMPLWTILTKWPLPTGPQCSQPSSEVPGSWSRPGVRSTLPRPGAQGLEDRLEPLDHGRLAADHQAVAALETEHAAAGAGIDVGDLLGGQVLGAPDIVLEVRVAAVDHRVAGLEQGREAP